MPKKTPHEIMEALMRKLKMFRGQPNTPENRAEMLRLIQGRLFDMALDLFWDDLQEALEELLMADVEKEGWIPKAEGDEGKPPFDDDLQDGAGKPVLEASGHDGGKPGPDDEPKVTEPPPAGTGG